MSRKAVISTAVASIHREARFSSEMVTQALIWETVEILKEERHWYHVRQEDGYEGWIYRFYIIENQQSFANWIILKDRFIPFITTHNKTSKDRFLSFGSRIPVIEEDTQFISIALPDGKLGKIPAQNSITLQSREQLIKLAKSLLGTPYIWGGKSSYGFDCSGFVQLVLSTIGISIARDTGIQVKTDWIQEINVNEAKQGDLLFFAENKQINHVGFSLGEGKIIHCSGEVKIESINEGDAGFNQYLSQSIFKTYSISAKVVD